MICAKMTDQTVHHMFMVISTERTLYPKKGQWAASCKAGWSFSAEVMDGLGLISMLDLIPRWTNASVQIVSPPVHHLLRPWWPLSDGTVANFISKTDGFLWRAGLGFRAKQRRDWFSWRVQPQPKEPPHVFWTFTGTLNSNYSAHFPRNRAPGIMRFEFSQRCSILQIDR